VTKLKTVLTIGLVLTQPQLYKNCRPQFFVEINESWYYMLNLPALHWGQKNRRVKVKGGATALNLLTQYILCGHYEWSPPQTGEVRGCLATALLTGITEPHPKLEVARSGLHSGRDTTDQIFKKSCKHTKRSMLVLSASM